MQMLTSIVHHVSAQQAVTDLHVALADDHLCTVIIIIIIIHITISFTLYSS